MQLPGQVAQVRIAVQLYSLPGSQVGVQQSWHLLSVDTARFSPPTLFQLPKRPEDQQVYLASGADNISFRRWWRGALGVIWCSRVAQSSLSYG